MIRPVANGADNGGYLLSELTNVSYQWNQTEVGRKAKRHPKPNQTAIHGVEQNRTAIVCLQSKYFTIKLQPPN